MPVPTIKSQLAVLHSTDGLVDLFCLDCSKFGGPVSYFSPQCYENGTNLSWGGQAYFLLPIGVDAFETKASNTDLPQATLTISNVGGPLLSVVTALGDITGATLTHTKTKVSYLDGQANPSTSQFIGPQVWYIYQMSQFMPTQSIQFTLACAIDRPGYQFPVRQVLKDPGVNPPDGIYFPGVSPYRTDVSQAQ